MIEYAILFFHHANDKLTKRHYDLLVKNNPDGAVVPITRGEKNHLPNAVDVYCADSPFAGEPNWYGADISLIEWFLQRPFDAERYIWLEYDCYCDVPMKEWYKLFWDTSFAVGSQLMTTKHNPEYYYFKDIPKMTPEMQDVAIASSPLNGLMVTHQVMLAITERPYPLNVFSELRLPSAIQAAGYPMSEMTADMQMSNKCQPHLIEGTGRRLYHPVKTLDQKVSC